MTETIELRYGINPHQKPAQITADNLPIKMLNGQPGTINLLDALNAWQLVRELKQATGKPAAASFKHVSPAGASIANRLSDTLRQAYFIKRETELSPLATAYARARGADRVSSFGDWIALSDEVDEPTARLIKREVSDGVIAPSYSAAALEILMKKKKGGYRIVQVDASYEPAAHTSQQIFGMTLTQKRNDWIPTIDELNHIVTAATDLPDTIKQDMLVAMIALKYTQSNSVCFALDGQIIGMGAGQQSRIHCTRLAAQKAEIWWLRQHPQVLNLPFREKIGRPERDNAIDQYLLDGLSPAEEAHWLNSFDGVPVRLMAAEKRAWLDQLNGVTLGSDAFFPFRDSIDRAQQSGVQYVVQPGGSIRDDVVIEACNQYGMAMAFTGVRLFHH